MRRLPAGSTVSYGRTATLAEDTTLAVLPVGYADGFVRLLSNKGSALVCGQPCPVVGRVCMDMLMVDVTHVPGVGVGDEVVIVGRQGDEEITLQQLADLAGTIDYEICTQLNARIPRIYKK